MAGSTDQRYKEDEIRLLDYWRVLLRRRLIVISCLALVVALVMIWTFLKVPIYQATTSLEIELRGPDILTFKDVLSVDSSWVGLQNFYPTQYKILQSDAVIRIAAERLDLVNRPEFVNRKASPVVRMLGWMKQSKAEEEDESRVAAGDPLEGAVTFIRNGLAIRPVRNSQLVNVSFNDRDPVLAAEIADAVADAFIQFRTDARYDMTGKAKEFLAKDVARVQGEISELQRRLQEYGVEKEILSDKPALATIPLAWRRNSGHMSRPVTCPVGPTASASNRAGRPIPHPASSPRLPGGSCRVWIAERRVASLRGFESASNRM